MARAKKQPDVYRDWLGIKEPQRPLDYYQILRLPRFEDDVERIRRHYGKLNKHVRKYAAGEFATLSQELLNELARSMLCLTDADRKSEYDASLGRKKVARGRRQTFEEILLSRGHVDREKLDKGRRYAQAVGLEVRDALMQQKLASPEHVMEAYAESQGMPFLNLADVTLDGELLGRVSAGLARRHSCAPLMIEGGRLLMASPNPLDMNVEEDLRLRLGMPLRMVICTPSDIHRIIAEHYSREAAIAEMTARSDQPVPSAKPTGLAKVWASIKKWVADHNKK